LHHFNACRPKSARRAEARRAKVGARGGIRAWCFRTVTQATLSPSSPWWLERVRASGNAPELGTHLVRLRL
jgi:hypothetical protein